MLKTLLSQFLCNLNSDAIASGSDSQGRKKTVVFPLKSVTPLDIFVALELLWVECDQPSLIVLSSYGVDCFAGSAAQDLVRGIQAFSRTQHLAVVITDCSESVMTSLASAAHNNQTAVWVTEQSDPNLLKIVGQVNPELWKALQTLLNQTEQFLSGYGRRCQNSALKQLNTLGLLQKLTDSSRSQKGSVYCFPAPFQTNNLTLSLLNSNGISSLPVSSAHDFTGSR